jgi:hypothetical protein
MIHGLNTEILIETMFLELGGTLGRDPRRSFLSKFFNIFYHIILYLMSATSKSKSKLDTFLDTNHISDHEFQQFIEENNININEKALELSYLHGMEPDRRKMAFFSEVYTSDTNNPFLVRNLNKLDLDTKEKLNTCIITIYEDIKKVMRTFDSGFSNSSFDGIRFTNQTALDNKFSKIAKDLKNKRLQLPAFFEDMFSISEIKTIKKYFKDYYEEGNSFNYFLYNLAHVLRDFDGHTLDDFTLSDQDAPFSEDYDIIRGLKMVSRPDDFLGLAIDYLERIERKGGAAHFQGIQDELGLAPSRCFLFLYILLLHSFINFGDVASFTTVLTDKTHLPPYITSQIASNIYGFGGQQRFKKKSKSKRNRSKKHNKSKKMRKNKSKRNH